MTPKTVLFLDHASALGGAEHSLLLLLKHLDAGRWQPVLGCTPGPLEEAAAALPVETVTLTYPRLRRSIGAPFAWYAGADRIRQAALKTGASLVYANTVRAALYGAFGARLAGVPFIWHMRDFWLSEAAPRVQLPDAVGKRLLWAASAAIIANSEAVARHLGNNEKISVVHNGIELDHYLPAPDTRRFKAEFGLPTDTPLVGTAGRLRPWKGQDVFLKSAKTIREQLPNVHFLIIGGSPFVVQDGYAESLPRLAETLGLSDRVTFTGHLADIRPALAALDIFVHSGDPEPFGLVNIEAMALGKPVIGFAHGALPEIVIDGKTGRLASPGDTQALAAAVLALLHHPDTAKKMGHAGKKRVLNRFSILKTAQEVDAVMSQVVA